MAGIGFELKKMFSKKGVFQLIRAYGYAGTVCVGPMLLGMFFSYTDRSYVGIFWSVIP